MGRTPNIDQTLQQAAKRWYLLCPVRRNFTKKLFVKVQLNK